MILVFSLIRDSEKQYMLQRMRGGRVDHVSHTRKPLLLLCILWLVSLIDKVYLVLSIALGKTQKISFIKFFFPYAFTHLLNGTALQFLRLPFLFLFYLFLFL